MGLLLTNPCCIMEMPSEALLVERYDNDMKFGPFIQDGLVEEDFASMDELDKTVIEAVTEEPIKSE